ncbi:unnamed protein product, partial [Prorocentrum cordatum]
MKKPASVGGVAGLVDFAKGKDEEEVRDRTKQRKLEDTFDQLPQECQDAILDLKNGGGNRDKVTKIINALVHRAPDGKLVVKTGGCDELWKQVSGRKSTLEKAGNLTSKLVSAVKKTMKKYGYGEIGRTLKFKARGCELWVSLLEKAMAKVGGGSYEMEGSNPGTDAFHLTGWLPESLPLGRQSREELDQSYDAFLEGWRAGDCVVCVGTTRLADAVGHEEARRRGYTEGVSPSTGLVANHAYPVLDLRSVRGTRLLLLKNPWGRVRWRGRWCPGDRSWQADAAAQEAVGDALTTVAGQDDGLFWIEWHDVARYFSHLYLCWAPHRLALHRLEA